MPQQIPELSGPDVQEQGFPNVHFDAEASLDDFGGGQSLENAGRATQGVAQTAEGIAAQAKQRADQIAFMSADAKASALQNQIQIGASKMLGQNALGAPDYAQSQWNDGIQQIQKGLSNPAQQMAFQRAAMSRWDELNKSVQYHVGNQIQQYADNETQSYIATSRNAAVLNAGDDDRVQSEIDRQTAVTQDYAARKGIPLNSPQYQDLLTNNLSATHSAVIQARLDKDTPDNVEQAKDYLDENRDQMTAQDLVRAQKSVDSAETVKLGMDTWNQVQGMKLSDGMPDEAKMEATIMGRNDLSDERKLEIVQFVKARAREQILQTHLAQADSDRQFMNSAIQARQQGVPLQDALKIADQYSTDDYDQAAKESSIRQMYAPPTQSDPSTYMSLWERVQNGTASRGDIDQAQQTGKINGGDWNSLRKELYKSQIDGTDPQDKLVDDRVKSMAQASLGSDKDKLAQYMYVYHTQTQGQTPEQKFKTATDLMGPDKNTGLWGMFQDKQYQAQAKTLDAQNLAWGKVYQDVGDSETKAIGQGVLAKGASSWGLGDVDSFAAQFGGYNNIKGGTPVNNAVQSLMRRGKLVTADNVKAVLNQYPDGKY